MGRRKTAGRCNIRPWLSAKADCKEGRFIQIGNSLLLSEQFGKLKAGARDLYFRMAMESGGEREFTFPASSAERHHIPASSFEGGAYRRRFYPHQGEREADPGKECL